MFDPNATKALIKDCDSCAVGVDAVVDRLDGVERCPPIQGAFAVAGPRKSMTKIVANEKLQHSVQI